METYLFFSRQNELWFRSRNIFLILLLYINKRIIIIITIIT